MFYNSTNPADHCTNQSFCLNIQIQIKMANTEVQNGQRGTIFLTFLAVLFFCILNIINFVKKRIDPVQASEENGEKYRDKKQGEADDSRKQKTQKKQKRDEDSTANFDGAAIAMKSQQVQDDDPTVIKVAKKNEQFQLIYYPLFVIFCINLVTGTTKAFSLVNYLFTLIIVFLFNVLKVHRKCSNHICLNLVFDNLWLLMIFFQILNLWAATPTQQPYIVTEL